MSEVCMVSNVNLYFLSFVQIVNFIYLCTTVKIADENAHTQRKKTTHDRHTYTMFFSTNIIYVIVYYTTEAFDSNEF